MTPKQRIYIDTSVWNIALETHRDNSKITNEFLNSFSSSKSFTFIISELVETEVSSAYELDQLIINKIVETLRRNVPTTNHAKDIKIEQKIDPTLIGGLKVKINDLVYDGSIKGRLENMRRRLG